MATQAVAKKRISRSTWREWFEGYLFASPFIIGFFLFTAYPMGYSLWLAFQKWDLLSPPEFIGFENFIKMFSDERANTSLYNSAYYTVIAVPIQLVISFALALALTQNIKFRDFYRAGFYLPIIVPLIASAVVWQRAFHPEYGIVNELLSWVGLNNALKPLQWLFDSTLAKPAFIIMSFWSIGRQMVIFIAGLGNIPQSLIEASSIDGAGPITRLFKITIPMMTPLIFYNMVIAIVNSFQSFIPALIMVDNPGVGPENSILFSVLNIYQEGFKFFHMGYASALSWELFVIIIGFTIAQFYGSQRWVYYED